MATIGPSTAAGGITACSLDPSGSLASRAGLARSMRRPRGATTRSTAATIAAASGKLAVDRSSRPDRSSHTSFGPFTSTSVTFGSRSNRSIGPRPVRASTTSDTTPGPARGASSGTMAVAAAARAPRSKGTSESSRRPMIRSTALMPDPISCPRRRSSGHAAEVPFR